MRCLRAIRGNRQTHPMAVHLSVLYITKYNRKLHGYGEQTSLPTTFR